MNYINSPSHSSLQLHVWALQRSKSPQTLEEHANQSVYDLADCTPCNWETNSKTGAEHLWNRTKVNSPRASLSF